MAVKSSRKGVGASLEFDELMYKLVSGVHLLSVILEKYTEIQSVIFKILTGSFFPLFLPLSLGKVFTKGSLQNSCVTVESSFPQLFHLEELGIM